MNAVRFGAFVFLIGVFGLGFALTVMAGDSRSASALVYPDAKRVDQVDDYHGVKVSDPYRWLEDTDSADTKAWVEAENKVTFSYLEQIPYRQAIHDRLMKLWNYERYGVPEKQGTRYFYQHNTGLQNQSVLYTVTSLADDSRLLLDPNTLSADGTVALSGLSVSHDGKFMAYSLSASGSDWQEWKVRDVETGKDTSDDLKWVKFSGASWTPDGKGFFYSRYDEPKENSLKGTNYFQKLYYHRLGTPQAEDVLVYERPDQKEWLFSGSVTDDGRYLIMLWLFLWMMTFSFAGGKFTRYFTVALPAVLITSALGVQFASNWIALKLAALLSAEWPRFYLRIALTLVVIASAFKAAVDAAPHFRLYTNALGGGVAVQLWPAIRRMGTRSW